ncbi:MAG: FAD-linked oxidase C-terminal domain-containing protein [Saprospiraceae bacterium]
MDVNGFKSACEQESLGFVYFDSISKAIYATDASLYQVLPLAVATPPDEDKLIKLVKLAYKFKIPILPRGSATSLAGQTTNQALVIDFTNHFNEILEINPEGRWALVQPGVVRDQLNKAVQHLSLHFAPDPATSSRATIGGMIANNSSGTKSIKYGITIDHVIALRVLLSDGTILNTEECTQDQWTDISGKSDREGQIYTSFRKIIFENTEEIRAAFPKVMRRVQGYPLDAFVDTENWNLSKLFTGSEGTLGIILDAKINLEPIPKFKAAFTLHYADRMEAIKEVKYMIPYRPAAIEMLDFNVFAKSKKHRSLRSIHENLIIGEPEATLSAEFFCESKDDLDASIKDFTAYLNSTSKAYAWPLLTTPQQLADMWTLRKNGLGLIMGDPDGRKPIPFIEDMAVPVAYLADYIDEVLKMCDLYGVKTILYAHASVGVLHVRPELDIMDSGDVHIMERISSEVFRLVKKYHGSWSGEHGDGRNRGYKLDDFFGPKVYHALRQVKELFDPQYILNPGIVIDVPPMASHLRFTQGKDTHKMESIFQYRDDHSFEANVYACSGVGACRNTLEGTMCPTFRATREEKDSTRARANALRFGLQKDFDFDGITDSKVLDVLDLCLSCKACKSECPSNVDMAKLKSEVLQKVHDEKGTSVKEKLVRFQTVMPKYLSGLLAPMVNSILQNNVAKTLLETVAGIDRRRTLPLYSDYTFAAWYAKHYVPKGHARTVALFNDTYINFYEPKIGIEALRLLDECGFDVELVNVGCCQRPLISNGFLKEARKAAIPLVDGLETFMSRGIPILVCEPSCTSALIDDIPDLLEDEAIAQMLKSHIFAIDVFLIDQWKSGDIQGAFTTEHNGIPFLEHCHQKALFPSADDGNFRNMDNGCCGMAGSFGYDRSHYEMSARIAGLTLKDVDKERIIIANGFSCRHQVKDFGSPKPVHWVEITHFKRKNVK